MDSQATLLKHNERGSRKLQGTYEVGSLLLFLCILGTEHPCPLGRRGSTQGVASAGGARVPPTVVVRRVGHAGRRSCGGRARRAVSVCGSRGRPKTDVGGQGGSQRAKTSAAPEGRQPRGRRGREIPKRTRSNSDSRPIGSLASADKNARQRRTPLSRSPPVPWRARA